MGKDNKINKYIIFISILFVLIPFVNRYLIFTYPLIVIILTLMRIEFGISFIILTGGMNFMSYYNEMIGILHPNSIQVIGMLIFGTISLMKLKKIKIFGPSKVFILFLINAFLSMFAAGFLYSGLKDFGKFVLLLMLLLILSSKEINLVKLCKLGLYSGLISIFVFNPIYYFVLGNNIILNDTGRIRLLGGGFLPTLYAPYMALCIIYSFICYKIEKKKIYIIASLPLFLYLILSNGRGAMVGLFIVASAYLIYQKAWFKIFVAYFVLFFLLLGIIYPYFMLEDTGTKSNLNEDHISQGRTMIWNTFYNIFLKKPIFGLGWGYTEEYSIKLTGIQSNHSEFLGILFEMGIIGFLIFCTYVIMQSYVLLKSDYPYFLIMFIFLFFMLQTLHAGPFSHPQAISFPVFCFLGLSLNNYYNQKKSPKNDSKGAVANGAD